MVPFVVDTPTVTQGCDTPRRRWRSSPVAPYGVGVVGVIPSREQLEAACCWEADDHVPGWPSMTDFRRTTRYHHARWREAQGHPIGTQPIVPSPSRVARQVGSRLPLGYARETGATFVTPAAFDAARMRTSYVEPHQSFDHQRLWADLLWSPALAFNVFGDMATDAELADRAVHTWWPDVPGTVREVRFAHSPGRLDVAYLNSLRQFDVAFILDLDDGTSGVVGLGVGYHERSKREVPKPENRWLTEAVMQRSGVFRSPALDLFGGSDLAVMFLDHLLLLSMLQHDSGRWSWGRYIALRPAGNVHLADAYVRYHALLADRETFAADTLERLLAAEVLPASTASAVRRRYVPEP